MKRTKEMNKEMIARQSGITLGQIIEIKEACYQQGKAEAIKEVLEKIDDMIKSYACFNDYDEMTVWDIRDDFKELKTSISKGEQK